jgi:hypothetical protein
MHADRAAAPGALIYGLSGRTTGQATVSRRRRFRMVTG